MQLKDLGKILGQPGRTNYYVVCPDSLGLELLIDRFLSPIASQQDIHHFQAKDVTKDRAREIEVETRFHPRTGVQLTHIVMWKTQFLPAESVGPILKAVEEAKNARFIFQGQSIPKKVWTLMSRSSVVRLPFLSRRAVQVNLQARNLDTKAWQELELYDGTLAGAIEALGMKNKLMDIRRELGAGLNGIARLLKGEDLMKSDAFARAMQDHLTHEDQAFLARSTQYNLIERRRLVTCLALLR